MKSTRSTFLRSAGGTGAEDMSTDQAGIQKQGQWSDWQLAPAQYVHGGSGSSARKRRGNTYPQPEACTRVVSMEEATSRARKKKYKYNASRLASVVLAAPRRDELNVIYGERHRPVDDAAIKHATNCRSTMQPRELA